MVKNSCSYLSDFTIEKNIVGNLETNISLPYNKSVIINCTKQKPTKLSRKVNIINQKQIILFINLSELLLTKTFFNFKLWRLFNSYI